jgi:hypothetical protein
MKRTVTAALVAVLALAGCGSGGSSAEGKRPFELVAAASAATMKAQTSRFAMHVTVDGSALFGAARGPIGFGAAGEIDYTSQKGRATFDFADLGEAGEAAPKDLEMVFAGTTVYVKGGPFGGTEEKPWVEIDATKVAAQYGGIGAGDLHIADPINALDYLNGVSDEVTEVGREKVRGADARHLRATLDPEKAAASLPAAAQGLLRQLNGGRGLDMDVWIDDAGRLRKLTTTIRLSQVLGALAPGDSESTKGGDGEKAAVTTTFELFDFGTKVDAAPPPPEQVAPPAAEAKPAQ